MTTAVGTFWVEDGFFITSRGLVLAGTLSGEVEVGYYLKFPDGTRWRVKGINYVRKREQLEILGLLVDASISSREELLKLAVIGATAKIFAS